MTEKKNAPPTDRGVGAPVIGGRGRGPGAVEIGEIAEWLGVDRAKVDALVDVLAGGYAPDAPVGAILALREVTEPEPVGAVRITVRSKERGKRLIEVEGAVVPYDFDVPMTVRFVPYGDVEEHDDGDPVDDDDSGPFPPRPRGARCR